MELEVIKQKGRDIKLVIFDLDGTLLTSAGEISDQSKHAIDELRKKDIKVCIASGRVISMIRKFYEALELKDFVISSNGAAIDDLSTNQPIQQLYLDLHDAQSVVEFCATQHIECNIFKREACYVQQFSQRLTRFRIYNDEAREQGSKEIDLVIYDKGISDYEQIHKLLVSDDNPKQINKVKNFVDQHTNLIYTTSGTGYLDVSCGGVSKGEAVVKIAQHLNIDLAHVAVFGDYDNDISMFKVAGLSFATANAQKTVLKEADFITLSNDDEGIAYAVKQFFL